MAVVTCPLMAFPCPQGFQAVVFVPVQMQTVPVPVPTIEEKKPALPVHVQTQFRKTRMCSHFLSGRCTLGMQCRFAHSKEELASAPDLRKTKLCFNFFRQQCFDENCSFAHGYDELRTTAGLYKTELCHGWSQGKCRFGTACRFAHGESELFAPPGPLLEPVLKQQHLAAKTLRSAETRSHSFESGSPTRARWSDLADSDDESDLATCWSLKDESKDESDGRSTRSGSSVAPSSDFDAHSVVSEPVPESEQTTLRLVNLPKSFGRSQLVELLQSQGVLDFDFVYLPADFKHQGCFGYSFVNFTSQAAASKAQAQLCEHYDASFAATQGLQSQIERLRNSPMMHAKVPDEAKPALYHQGSRVAFPEPTKRITAPKLKSATA